MPQQTLLIPMERMTPMIKINPSIGVIEIIGKSVPEDAIGFYLPVLDKFENTNWNTPEIKFVIQLEYISTQSIRMLFRLFQMADNLFKRRIHKVSMMWYCEEDDEELIRDSEDFKNLLNMPFEIVILSTEEYDGKIDLARNYN